MRYRVGDKVRVVQSREFPGMVGKIYEVSDAMRYSKTFACRVIDVKTGWNPLMFDYEIEKVPIKGQQLVFEFMV